MRTAVLVVAIVVGIALIAMALHVRSRERAARLMRLLDTQSLVDRKDVAEVTLRTGLLRPVSAAAESVLQRLDRRRGVAARLERAAIPLRPGEYAVAVVVVGLLLGLWLWASTGQPLLIVAGVVLVPLVGGVWLDGIASRRRRALEAQLPDLLSSLAASVRGGHTLLRATALLAEETADPLRSELERLLAENQLGVPIVDAFARLAARVEIETLDWVVEAVRVQQQVGGQLSDLLFTLADHLRDRQELRREVRVLTADGRLSAWVLSLLPVALAVFIALRSPEYLAPLFRGPGLLLLAVAVLGIGLGAFIIGRMVRRIAR